MSRNANIKRATLSRPSNVGLNKLLAIDPCKGCGKTAQIEIPRENEPHLYTALCLACAGFPEAEITVTQNTNGVAKRPRTKRTKIKAW